MSETITLSDKLTTTLKGWWALKAVRIDLAAIILLMVYVAFDSSTPAFYNSWDPFWAYIDAEIAMFFSPILFLVIVASHHLFLKLTVGSTNVPLTMKEDISRYFIYTLRTSWCLILLSTIFTFIYIPVELLPDATLFFLFYLQVIQILHLSWILGGLAELHIKSFWVPVDFPGNQPEGVDT